MAWQKQQYLHNFCTSAARVFQVMCLSVDGECELYVPVPL